MSFPDAVLGVVIAVKARSLHSLAHKRKACTRPLAGEGEGEGGGDPTMGSVEPKLKVPLAYHMRSLS